MQTLIKPTLEQELEKAKTGLNEAQEALYQLCEQNGKLLDELKMLRAQNAALRHKLRTS